jgi:hypothetical protein
MGDTESGEFQEHAPEEEGISDQSGSDLEGEDELRVQRTEEELRGCPARGNRRERRHRAA